MPDKNALAYIKLAADLQEIVGVASERAILGAIIGGKIGLASANVIEQDNLVIVLERRRNPAPAEARRERRLHHVALDRNH